MCENPAEHDEEIEIEVVVQLEIIGVGVDDEGPRAPFTVDQEHQTVEGKSLAEWYYIGQSNQAAMDGIHTHPRGSLAIALLAWGGGSADALLYLQASYCSATKTERARLDGTGVTPQALGLDLNALEAQLSVLPL